MNYETYLGEKRPCVLCHSNQFTTWARDGVFEAVQCKECSLVFMNPCLTSEGLTKYYQGHHDVRMSDDDLCRKRDRMYLLDRDFVLEVIQEGRMLDIGCGGGFFLNTFDSEKWKRSGVEIDPTTPGFAADQFGLTDVRLWDSKTIPYPDKSFDLVLSRGSFEHLVDPHIVARDIARVVKPNGYFYICSTPNVESFCANLYREKWNMFHSAEHIFHFSLRTLRRLFEPLGFVTVKTTCMYEETPYCDVPNDVLTVLKDYQLDREGRRAEMGKSPAFWGTMLSIIFKRTELGLGSKPLV